VDGRQIRRRPVRREEAGHEEHDHEGDAVKEGSSIVYFGLTL